MRIRRGSASQTPLSEARGQCKWCGNAVMWHTTFDESRVPLIPRALPSALIPARYRWHVFNGIAHLGEDPAEAGTCRVKHSSVCPALSHQDLDEQMYPLVAKLRANMETLVREHGFIPHIQPPRSETEVEEPDPDGSTGGVRHVLHHYGSLRIAPGPLSKLQCVARIIEDHRCIETVFDESEGVWEQIDLPQAPGRAGQIMLSSTGGRMWVWSLLPDTWSYTPAVRWMRQYCHGHAGMPPPEQQAIELRVFDPLRHGDFALTRPPEGMGPVRHEEPQKVDSFENAPAVRRALCATDGCQNSTVMHVENNWRCYQCQRKERQRRTTHRRWNSPRDRPRNP